MTFIYSISYKLCNFTETVLWYFHSRLRAVPLQSVESPRLLVFFSLASLDFLARVTILRDCSQSTITEPGLPVTTKMTTSLKKMNLRSFELYRVSLDPFNLTNVGVVSVLNIQVQRETGKSSSYVHVLHKTSHLEISRRVRAVVCNGHQRNVLESVMHVQSCCFAYKISCFLTLSPTFDKLIE